MSLLVKRYQWSKNNTETIYSTDSSSRTNKSSINDNQSELNENLVRHDQYQRQRTQSDGHLTAKGQKQACYAAHFLISQLPDNVLFDSLTHSDSNNKKKKNFNQKIFFVLSDSNT